MILPMFWRWQTYNSRLGINNSCNSFRIHVASNKDILKWPIIYVCRLLNCDIYLRHAFVVTFHTDIRLLTLQIFLYLNLSSWRSLGKTGVSSFTLKVCRQLYMWMSFLLDFFFSWLVKARHTFNMLSIWHFVFFL